MKKVRDLTEDEVQSLADVEALGIAKTEWHQREMKRLGQKHADLTSRIIAEVDGGQIEKIQGGFALFAPAKKNGKKKAKK